MKFEWKRFKPYWKSLYMGICTFIMSCGFQTTQNYQSGINKTNGYISVALIYGIFGLSQFITPALVHFLTPKYSMFVACLCYLFYIASNIKLIIPLYFVASSVCGFGAALLWSGSSTLMSGYEQECNHPSHIYTLFFVPTYMCFLGNIVSLVFTPDEPMIMFIALTVLASISAIMYLFGYNSPPVPMESTKEVMLSTCKQFFNWRLALFFPIAILFGISRSFYYTTMPTLAPVSVTAYIFICNGATMSIASICWDYISAYFTEKISILISIIFEVVAVILAFVINEHFLHNSIDNVPESNMTLNVLVCLLGGIAGIGDAGLEMVVTAALNRVWPKEVSPLCAWRTVYLGSMCVALLYSAFINYRIILIIFAIVTLIGLGFIILICVMYKKIYLEIETMNNEKVKELLEEEHLIDDNKENDENEDKLEDETPFDENIPQQKENNDFYNQLDNISEGSQLLDS